GGASSGGAGSGGGGSGGAGSGGAGSGGDANNGNYLNPDVEGWVDQASNDGGSQGSSWVTAATNGSRTELNTSSNPGQACVNVSIAQVNESCGLPVGDCYAQAWGASLGYNLNQDSEGLIDSWDADAEGIDGFSFNLTAPTVVGRKYRLKVVVAGEEIDYCSSVSPGLNVVRFVDLKKNCWNPEPGLIDPTQIEHIQIHFVSNGSTTWGGQHCLSNLQARTPAAPGKAVVPHEGWVSGSTNTIGVEGAAFTFADTAGSTIEPENFSGFGSPLC